MAVRGIGRLRAKGSAASDPEPPSENLAAWYKLGTGITESSGAVSQWADQSGNSRNLVQATGSAQPALQVDGSILGDGSGDFIKLAWTLPQPWAVFMVLKQVSWTANDRIFSHGSENFSSTVDQQTSTPQIRLFAGLSPGNVSPTLGTWYTLSTVANGASSLIQLNEETAVTGGASTNPLGGISLFARQDGNNAWNGYIAEVLVYSDAPDADKRALIRAYLDSVRATL